VRTDCRFATIQPISYKEKPILKGLKKDEGASKGGGDRGEKKANAASCQEEAVKGRLHAVHQRRKRVHRKENATVEGRKGPGSEEQNLLDILVTPQKKI